MDTCNQHHGANCCRIDADIGDTVEITYVARRTSYGAFGIEHPTTWSFKTTELGYLYSICNSYLQLTSTRGDDYASARGDKYKTHSITIEDIVGVRVVERARSRDKR